MADFDELSQKYAPVILTIQNFEEMGAKLDAVDMEGEKLYIKAELPSKVMADRVWDVINDCDPSHSDLEDEIATTGGNDQEYHLKSGDTLSKLSRLFYGDPDKDHAIARASGMVDVSDGFVGQRIVVPALS